MRHTSALRLLTRYTYKIDETVLKLRYYLGPFRIEVEEMIALKLEIKGRRKTGSDFEKNIFLFCHLSQPFLRTGEKDLFRNRTSLFGQNTNAVCQLLVISEQDLDEFAFPSQSVWFSTFFHKDVRPTFIHTRTMVGCIAASIWTHFQNACWLAGWLAGWLHAEARFLNIPYTGLTPTLATIF